MRLRTGITEAVAAVPTRRLLLIAAVVFAFLAIAAVASADSGKSKAKFTATSEIFAVGPADLLAIPTVEGSSTDITVKRHPVTGDIKKITVNTVNEAVVNNPLAGFATGITGCEDSDGGGACGAVDALILGSSLLSLHNSSATLNHVVPDPFASGVLTSIVGSPVETYSGDLRGKLQGAFVVTGSVGPLVGDARLKIKGTATYACFVPNPFGPVPPVVPAPDLTACEFGSPGALFLPVVLNVMDKGSFKIEPDAGTVIAGPDHELVKMKGKLEVTVDAAFGDVFPSSVIDITKAKAKFVSTLGASDDDDD